MTIGAIAIGSTIGVIEGEQQSTQPTFKNELGFVSFVGADAVGSQISVDLNSLNK